MGHSLKLQPPLIYTPCYEARTSDRVIKPAHLKIKMNANVGTCTNFLMCKTKSKIYLKLKLFRKVSFNMQRR